MVSPVYLEIAIHYWTRHGDFDRADAPACAAAIEEMVRARILERVDSEKLSRVQKFVVGPAMSTWINALCSVPYPVPCWVIPDPKEPTP